MKRPGKRCTDTQSDFETSCFECEKFDYLHGSIIFNSFIFCQVFNQYSSRMLNNELNIFQGIFNNYMFLVVSFVILGVQVFLIEIGTDFLKTSPMTLNQWLITIALGAVTIPLGFVMRLIPVHEDPNSFYNAPWVKTQKPFPKKKVDSFMNSFFKFSLSNPGTVDSSSSGEPMKTIEREKSRSFFFKTNRIPSPEVKSEYNFNRQFNELPPAGKDKGVSFQLLATSQPTSSQASPGGAKKLSGKRYTGVTNSELSATQQIQDV